MTPTLVATAAGVARSTFYAHYSGKPALLRHVLQRVLQPLADTVSPARPVNSLEPVLEHFWANRRLARVVMTGRPRLILQGRLAELVEMNLRRDRIVLQVSLPMAAACIAHGQVAILELWLAGQASCRVVTLAGAIRAVALASVQGFSEPRTDRLSER